ncbi:Extensin-like protein C-terminus [Roseivivax halotolerans]|jgi:hypothetical protein|uniref:Extensin-like protein C-terminus n=1 Tax=Roseivivax halotolerans TaxID=93684 RepID=A0A1I5V6N1_9RHOB|nr:MULTISPECIES: extensin family protein [Roseivivax]QFT64853.1 hypothetical protein FIU91_18090 [Roseivivax sp. THAF30]SFQ03169.1 Extensin-like protein C-terminus [Roseivivax halotolerans]
MIRRFCLVAALTFSATAHAAAPDSSLRPIARGVSSETVLQAVTPIPRPESFEELLASRLLQRFSRFEPIPRNEPLDHFPGYEDTDIRAFAAATPLAVRQTLRPERRSQSLVQKAMARQRERDRGALCGDPDIQGEYVGYVPGRINGCGVEDAVEVRAVSGVALSQRAVLHCSTARALKSWVNRAAKPAVGSVGGGISELRVAAHYNCRTRNHQPGAPISEHGKGRAIDISAITLRDGSQLSVLGGYRTANQGPILKRMYKGACGIFGTTLGPDSDRYHQDHFHFDTARHRSGSYCGP